jgi:phosphoglycolate phosphatase-like HAD superfamily hydrolase
MVKKILFIGILLNMGYYLMGQNYESKADDYARIALHAYVPAIAGMPDAARNMLRNKLEQIATQTGAGGNAVNPRFIITANVSVLSKDVTATSPPMTALTLEVTFFVGDAQTKTKYASASIQAKGVGTNETKAYIECLKNIKPTAPELKNMVETGKRKIIEYYNSQCDFILKKAESLASQNRYEEALFELMSVPDVCKDCYHNVLSAVGPIYKKYADKACVEKLNAAKAIWAGQPNAEGANKVAQILSSIDPEAACMPDVQALVEEIKAKIAELEKRDWDFQMKVFDSAVELEKQRIEAARQVGIAYGNNQPEQVINLDMWK